MILLKNIKNKGVKKMKKKILGLLSVAIMIISLVGCSNNLATKNNKNGSILESTHFKIDGIYVDESYQDENLGLLYLFYTINAGDENLELASVSTEVKVNDKNSYDATVLSSFIPKYTNYYYGTVIKKIYVGKSYKICSTFKVAKGDLEGSKIITLDNYKINDIDKIKFTTDDIKKMENIAKIAEDLDKETYNVKYKEEQDKLATADDATVKKVKNDINGYYFEGYVNVGQTLQKIKLEFEAPNKFNVNLAGLKNNGTYEVKKGMITLDYGDGPRIFLEYNYINGDINITNLNEQFGTLVEYDPLGEDD